MKHLAADPASPTRSVRAEKWTYLFRNATPDFDSQGRPVLRIQRGEEVVSVGISSSNIFAGDEPQALTKQLLEARLHAELRRGSAPKVSESDVASDWDLLQRARNNTRAERVAQSNRPPQTGSQVRPGNHP